jgi:hypothetical protein
VLQRHTENFNLGKSWLIGDQTSTAVGTFGLVSRAAEMANQQKRARPFGAVAESSAFGAGR